MYTLQPSQSGSSSLPCRIYFTNILFGIAISFILSTCPNHCSLWALMNLAISSAGHGSRAVWGMYCLRSLGSRDRGFESHSGHGRLVFVYMCAFFCVCVQVEALRRADHPPKESYWLSMIQKKKTEVKRRVSWR
jgi:hypothetical protein